ncbi:MAG: amidohydrolase [Myxococcota bacterium]
MRILRVIVVAALVLVVGVVLLRALDRPGAKLYVGGSIVTMDPQNRVVEALAVDGDRIVSTGSRAELRAWAEDAGAEVIDLEGRTIVPGFIDAHGHFPGAGLTAVFVDLNSPPIGSVESIENLVTLLSQRAAETPEGEWILGIGYDDTLMLEQRHPTRHDLDRASTRHPIGVLHISGHLGVANTAALEVSGISAETPDPQGGLIRREDAGGRPNGVLEETATQPITSRLVPGFVDVLRMLERAKELYLEQGVTTAQSGATAAGLVRLFDWASWLGLVPLRLIVWPTPAAADSLLTGELEAGQWDPLRLRVGAVKMIADGSIQGYTGYLREPYRIPPGDDPFYRGYPRIPRDELIERVQRYHGAGLQLAIHGNGDASIDDILDAIELAQAESPRADARHIIIHAQMAGDDQLDRMKRLGVLPSFFSLHTFYWGDRHRRIFMGPERAARISPAKSALARGVRFTIHCDAPVVPMEPLRLVWAAVNRKTRSDFTLGEAERISPMQALAAVTIDAAWQHFEEDVKGSLEPGKLADFVILSRSPLDDPETIDEIEVIETVIGGRTEYRR